MTPYVELQKAIIDWLYTQNEQDLRILLALLDARTVPHVDWVKSLRDHGCHIGTEPWVSDAIVPILREQLDGSGDAVVIRNLLGVPLYQQTPYNLETWVEWRRGSGQNALRSERYAQPSALKVGDTLITGERVLSPSREGGNGETLIHLSHGKGGVWLGVPARLALALVDSHDGQLPEGLVEQF